MLILIVVVRYDFRDAVTVLVGPKEEAFMVYKSFLCNRSAFFSAAIVNVGSERQGHNKLLRLPQVDVAAFEVYVGWVYTTHINVSSARHPNGEVVTRAYTEIPVDEQTANFKLLIKCSALGHALEDIGFQNTLADEFIAYAEAICEVPPANCIKLLCEVVPLDSMPVALCAD